MDQSALVSSGHGLLKSLDAAGLPPRLAMWVHGDDVDIWKLWIVPPAGMVDKHDFYRRVAQIIAKLRVEVGDLSTSDIEMVSDKHPAVQGIGSFLRAPGLTAARFSGNRFNGYYLPDGIILRSDLKKSVA